MNSRHIVIIGSGFAALTAVRTLRRRDASVRITLVSPRAELMYYPSLIWVPAGLRRGDDLRIDIAGFLAEQRVTFHAGRVTGLADGGRTVLTDSGNLANDALLIASGGRFLKSLPGIEHALTLCEGAAAAESIRERLAGMEGGTIAFGFGTNPKEQGAMRGGPMFELLFGIDTLLKRQGRRERFRLVFFNAAREPGKRLGEKAVAGLLREMEKRGIATHLGHKITGFEADRIRTEGGDVPADLILFMPGMSGPAWARARVTGNDELTLLGNAFDRMLDERVADLAKQAEENEQINNSVIQLMDAADRLCQRDLTVMVPVSADITGNVSDALNQMTRQTARVMGDINKLAAQLETVAGAVRRQGGKVSDVATVEREVVRQVLDKLTQSANTMADMAQLAASCNEISDKASRSTKQALLTVRDTVQSINEIRNSVGETEKSIKRLGERSQEIGGIVEIIKDIAERTHTLAINAGMQAVAAGEAGRGFSVVADEVQRLAETARESTRQIAALVQSIQAESSETMSTMNKTIGQVVAGSELAAKAGQRMRFTQRNTQELVAAVQQIAERSKVQEAINVELHDRANKLEQSTAATEQELREQTEQAESMFEYLSNLVKSVRVFKLPEAA